MQIFDDAFSSLQFYIVVSLLSLMFGYGGIVHLKSILGHGEFGWPGAALRFKIADVVWGLLDFGAVIGTFIKAPFGPMCLVLAAASQIVAYGLFPAFFATKPEHLKVLRGMVWFHVVVLTVFAVSLGVAVRSAN